MGKPKVEEMVIGFMPGSFDLAHAGHVLALADARANCDYLVVGLLEDPSIDRPTKNKPIMSLDERKILLGGSRYVNDILVYHSEAELHEMDAEPFYQIRFMGADHKGKKHHPINCKVLYIQRNHSFSSTELRKRIYNAELALHRT